ncbi:MAG: hypothetical protein ACRDLF_07680 [Solirubrobacteraceae bacterium]
MGLLAGVPGVASARPVVTLKAAAVPIPIDLSNPHSATYPGTGAILGAPAALELEDTISGIEYWGSPSPLTQIKVYTPAGVTVHTQGFATCTEAILLTKGAAGCPKRSFVSTLGEAMGVVSFGGTRIHERATLQGFFNAAGGYIFYVVGSTPVSLEIVEKGTLTNASPPFGKLFTGEVPLVETVPGAPDASVEQFKLTVGAAFKQGKRLISYATAPRTCPKGGAPLKVELSFLSGETVPTEERLPCPKHR